ncbi:MAG: tyrosine-protein phosphatase [Mangrovibacterium sp.]
MLKFNLSVCVLAMASLSLFFSCNKEENESDTEYKTYNNHIELSGEENFRDLGGIVCSDGRRILYRKLFRSGELSGLTENDSTKVANLGIEQMFDLRTPEEVAVNPDKVSPNTKVYFFPLISDSESSTSDIISGKISIDEFMYPTYTVDANKTAMWTKIFDLLETGKVSHWHCTSGKDRAGMTAVLLLHALGANKETAIENFMASNAYLSESADSFVEHTAQIMIAQGYDSDKAYAIAEKLKPLCLVRLNWIEHFYASIEEQYGDMDSYLDTLGIDREALRKAYLEE